MYRIFITDTGDTRFDTSGTVRGMIDAHASGGTLVVTRGPQPNGRNEGHHGYQHQGCYQG